MTDLERAEQCAETVYHQSTPPEPGYGQLSLIGHDHLLATALLLVVNTLKQLAVPPAVERGVISPWAVVTPIADAEQARLLAELRAWAGSREDLECIHCKRKPIFGLFESVGPGKALCGPCRDTREIRALKDKITLLRDRQIRSCFCR